MAFDPKQPYNALPELSPAADIESKPLLKACIEARAALAALKSAGGLIPNQAVLINTIPLLEAQASYFLNIACVPVKQAPCCI